jgi:hypothetical protein
MPTQELDKTVLHNLITRGDINIAGVDTVEYEGRDIPLEIIYGALPEGANYWVAEDLNGDGLLEVFAASTSESGEETIYNVYDINPKGNVVSTDYQDYQANIQAAASGYGVEITCLVDGCSISIIPDYGFWMTIRDAFKSITTFPESSDEQELAEAQMFQFFTRKLEEASNGDIDKATFLSDLENSGYPFNDAFMRRFEKQFENAQYNGFLNRIGALFEEGDGQAIQDFFDKYENSGIADNSFVIENSFSLMNPQNVLDRMILGDGDWGVTIQMCTSTVTTNCVDPKAINDIWEDFGRHIQVIFKGLEIPGLPEWLPLPGIMRLPTIGEIWDKVTGPFTDAAREQLKDCMSKDDDGDGVNNTASYCMENRDIIGIITKGLEDGATEIIDATTEAVGGIVDKALEGIDCVLNPVDCASKIKDVLEGVLGGADPTQPGLPPWMRAIIIGSQYGDEVLKELEKIFDSDIDGDGVIGITTEQVTCWDGSVVDKEEDCPEDTRVDCWDGSKADSLEQCPVDTRDGATVEECNQLGRVHVPDASNQTKGSCGGCKDDINTVPENENDPMSPCVAPENPDPNEGDPCNTGAPLNAEGTIGPAPDYECEPNENATCTDPETGKEGVIKNGQCVVETVTPEIDCTQPRPSGPVTFDLIDAQDRWDAKCKDTHCPSGVPIDAHVDSDCSKPLKEVGTNPGDACDLAEAGYSSGGVGVIDANGDCKRVGQACNRQSYGFGPSDNCSTGLGFNTAQGVIDSNGDCVCNEACDDPNREVSRTTGACLDTCKFGWKKDAEGNCTVEDTGVDECTDPNRNTNDDGSCADTCTDGSPAPASGLCPAPVEECVTPDGTATGAIAPDCTECPTGQDFDTNGICVDIDITENCENGATNYPDCDQCPKGQILNTQGICVTTVDATCDEQNRVTNDNGTCGECKAGFTFDTDQDLCIADGGEDVCANGATDFPACTTCPEGQSMDEEGICSGVTPPPETGGGGPSGGSLGGGGGGMMTGISGYMGDPQLLSRTEFPITDYLAGLFENIRGNQA